MNYQIITDVSRINKEQWSEFVYYHPKGNLFQTPEMLEVYKASKNYEPLCVVAIDSDNNILGLILAVIQREYKGVFGQFSARAIIWGAPIVKDCDLKITNRLIEEYDNVARRKVIYTQFRNLWNFAELQDIFTKRNYHYEDHVNIIVDLTKSEEELWKEVHSKRRNEIRRAYKEGTEFRVYNDINSLHESYNILTEVYTNAKLPLADFSFFKELSKNSNERFGLKNFCAINNGKIIGCLLALIYKDTIYDFYAGSYSDYYNKYPNDLIPWGIFQWGNKNNYKIFDFGGAGKPNVQYGVRNYKKKFGGKLVNYGRFEKIHKPLTYKLVKAGFGIWKKLR